MKNLKKVLALVLAFACAFTMFAGAAFTDQADIKVDSEVVDTLVSLGVINGYTDGSFKPNDTVTRAEMAKMIYVLRTGNSDASAYNNDKTTFTDINGHWARGYVKYCQSLGIIAGQSATKFAPDQTVTAQEAAKMLLVTLGYDATKAGLVGAGWASKTNALADENGLLEDVNTSFTAACPRQYAAQLIYNAIDTATVVWRDDAYTKYNYDGKENKTIGEKYMGLEKFEAKDNNHNNILTEVKKEDNRDTYAITVNGKTFTRVVSDYTNSSYDFVIVGGVVLFADETQGSVKNVAYISGVNNSADTIVGDSDVTVKVRMYFPDKTDAEVKVSKIAGTKLKKGTGTAEKTKAVDDIKAILKDNGLVTYSKLSDGTYDIKAVSDKNLAGTDDFVSATEKHYHDNTKNGAYYDSKINKVSVDDEAVIYVKTANETKVLTGKQLKNWDKTVDTKLVFTAAYLVEETNGINYVKVAVLDSSSSIADVPGSKDSVYAYAVTDKYTATVDGEDKDAVQVWNGTEVVTLYADGTFNATIKAGDLFSYKVNGKYIEKIDTTSQARAAVIGFDGKAKGEITLQVKDSKAQTYTLDEDVVVMVVNDGDNKGVAEASISSIVEAGYNKNGTKRIENVKFILGTGEDNDKVVAIVIDQDNELHNAKEV